MGSERNSVQPLCSGDYEQAQLRGTGAHLGSGKRLTLMTAAPPVSTNARGYNTSCTQRGFTKALRTRPLGRFHSSSSSNYGTHTRCDDERRDPTAAAALDLRWRTRLFKLRWVSYTKGGSNSPSCPLSRDFWRDEHPSDMGENPHDGSWGLGRRKRFAEGTDPTLEHCRTFLRFQRWRTFLDLCREVCSSPQSLPSAAPIHRRVLNSFRTRKRVVENRRSSRTFQNMFMFVIITYGPLFKSIFRSLALLSFFTLY
ncbi:hypothetical protein BDM02DRAFT_399157 [Thelephora ganbajun]|uniref:Uncharacterized protein n=1 Tax=Thelephora ganbajun TaxID=370292 RepID=A0ACB6Z859_THEGA|nr:hypothetical protein BDM02DRAFT_399157 [Thelephora ganbajun]